MGEKIAELLCDAVHAVGGPFIARLGPADVVPTGWHFTDGRGKLGGAITSHIVGVYSDIVGFALGSIDYTWSTITQNLKWQGSGGVGSNVCNYRSNSLKLIVT